MNWVLGVRVFFKKLVVTLILAFQSFGLAGNLDWDPTKRVPIRERILECAAYISPADPKVNDSVGVKLSSNRVEDFAEQMKLAIEDRGRDYLRGSHLFITGVAMGDEVATRARFELALSGLGFSPGEIRVRVLSIPKKQVRELSGNAFQYVKERIKYFFPSIARDYQSPTTDEVVSGFLASAVIEAFNVVYLYRSLPLMDAHLTVGLHTALLVVYSVYKKFITNWLLRPGGGRVEMFLKQVSLSFPFVANYNIFGNFSKIMDFYQTNGWEATLGRFPAEMANFTVTQGLTLFLQTLFYNMVITKGVRGWENRQEGVARSADARVFSNWVTVPILALDAVFLAMAAGNGEALMHLGPMDINAGHASLALLTTIGSALWVWPKMLDPVLDWYQSIKGFFSRFKGFLSFKGSFTEEEDTKPDGER